MLQKQIIMIKLTDIEGKIPSNTGLTTAAALTAVRNKIPDASNFPRKIYYDTEILDINSKYFTAAYYNKFTNKKLDLKIK